MEGPQKIASKWSAVEPPPPRRIDSQPVKRAPTQDFAPKLVSKHPAPAPAPAPPAELDERVCMLHCEDPPYSAKLLLRGRVLAGPARKVLASFAAGLSKRHPEAGAVDPEALVVTCQGARVYPTYTLDCLDSGVGDLELLVALPAEPEPEPEPEAESSDDDDLPPFEDIAAADDDDDDDDDGGAHHKNVIDDKGAASDDDQGVVDDISGKSPTDDDGGDPAATKSRHHASRRLSPRR